jgi:hypothetical protein
MIRHPAERKKAGSPSRALSQRRPSCRTDYPIWLKFVFFLKFHNAGHYEIWIIRCSPSEHRYVDSPTTIGAGDEFEVG